MTVSFTWKMAPRAEQWQEAWDETSDTYDPDYVVPPEWQVDLIAGKRTERASAYRWQVRGQDATDFVRTPEGERVAVNVPRPGAYDVTLTVSDENGAEDSTTQTIQVEDVLIVSIGDSAASGEGNPDLPEEAVELEADLENPVDVNGPIWLDVRCHRSPSTAHAQAAQRWEEADPHRAVTFLSFACSGAELETGLLHSYEGQEPDEDDEPLPPQLDAIAQALDGTDRLVDALFVTAGMNDLGFGAFMKTIATPDLKEESERVKETVRAELAELDARYDALASALAERLGGKVREVYVVEYPADVFHDDDGERGGCNLVSLLTAADADFMVEMAEGANDALCAAAERHGWHYVGGVSERFQGHGYCCEESWFVRLPESLMKQLNIDGSVHPNRKGHAVIAEQIVAKMKETMEA